MDRRRKVLNYTEAAVDHLLAGYAEESGYRISLEMRLSGLRLSSRCLLPRTGRSPFFAPAQNDFANTAVRSYVLEVPVAITGHGRVHFWATTAYFDTGHNTWVQTQRAGKPNMTTFFLFDTGSAKVANFNSTAPTFDLVGRPAHPAKDPASGIWGQVRDNIAAVVKAGGTYDNRPHKFPAARAYGAWAADALPNVIGFTPGTVALWDPWCDVQNGKDIIEDIASNIIKMVVNQDFSSGLVPGPVLDHFPYLAPPPGS
jgi:hypothetical protein